MYLDLSQLIHINRIKLNIARSHSNTCRFHVLRILRYKSHSFYTGPVQGPGFDRVIRLLRSIFFFFKLKRYCFSKKIKNSLVVIGFLTGPTRSLNHTGFFLPLFFFNSTCWTRPDFKTIIKVTLSYIESKSVYLYIYIYIWQSRFTIIKLTFDDICLKNLLI